MPSESLVRAFRDCVGEFVTGVAVVVTEVEGQPSGMTLNSFTSVSLSPLLVLVSLAHGTRTLSAVRRTGRYSVSILAREDREAALEFAERGAPFPLERVVRGKDGFLVVGAAVATMSCEVSEIVTAGDHDLVIGEVVGITHAGGSPLLFHRSRFGGFQTDALVPPGAAIGLEEGAGW